MSEGEQQSNALQVLFLVLGLICLGMAFWAALAGPDSERQGNLLFMGGMSAVCFVLTTVIHLRH